MKKFISVLIAIALLIPLASLPLRTSAAENVLVSVSAQINDLDSGENDFTFVDVDEDDVSFVRQKLHNHVSSFSITVDVKEYDRTYLMNYCDSLFAKALEHTGDPVEGDYISCQLVSHGYGCTLSGNASYLKMEINYSVEYFTTKQQENELDEKVKQIINSLNLSQKDDYENIKAVYDYMTSNITYDWKSYERETKYKEKAGIAHSAYSALCKGTAVCQGYANAMYRLLLSAGVDCRIISGYSEGEGHAWNIAAINGKYYLLDSTWDAGKSHYDYFLCGTSKFPNHVESNEFKTKDFTEKYPISKISFFEKTSTDTDTNSEKPNDTETDTDSVKPKDTENDIDTDSEKPRDTETDIDTDSEKTNDTDSEKDSDSDSFIEYVKIGDINKDGKITSADSLKVLRVSVHLETLDNFEEKLADADGNGTINSSDSLDLLRYSVNLQTNSNRIGTEIKMSISGK